MLALINVSRRKSEMSSPHIRYNMQHICSDVKIDRTLTVRLIVRQYPKSWTVKIPSEMPKSMRFRSWIRAAGVRPRPVYLYLNAVLHYTLYKSIVNAIIRYWLVCICNLVFWFHVRDPNEQLCYSTIHSTKRPKASCPVFLPGVWNLTDTHNTVRGQIVNNVEDPLRTKHDVQGKKKKHIICTVTDDAEHQ